MQPAPLAPYFHYFYKQFSRLSARVLYFCQVKALSSMDVDGDHGACILRHLLPAFKSSSGVSPLTPPRVNAETQAFALDRTADAFRLVASARSPLPRLAHGSGVLAAYASPAECAVICPSGPEMLQ